MKAAIPTLLPYAGPATRDTHTRMEMPALNVAHAILPGRPPVTPVPA